MQKNRLEAFSDGVLAIIITIMVLELKVPRGADWDTLWPLFPVFLSYVLSFAYVGIYWNNHHHLFQATPHVSAGILWTNLNLLFWLSLFPFSAAWMGQNHFSTIPTVLYGAVLLLAAMSYTAMQYAIIHHQGPGSMLAAALGSDWKGKLSILVYVAAIPLAFVNPAIAQAMYVLVALVWIVPDRRIEDILKSRSD